MELYKEILAEVLAKCGLQITFGNSELDVAKIVELECYKALQKIKEILDDDSLSDPDCFYKIDEIVSALYEAGIYAPRHDFS